MLVLGSEIVIQGIGNEYERFAFKQIIKGIEFWNVWSVCHSLRNLDIPPQVIENVWKGIKNIS